jgi:hypothetical protein
MRNTTPWSFSTALADFRRISEDRTAASRKAEHFQCSVSARDLNRLAIVSFLLHFALVSRLAAGILAIQDPSTPIDTAQAQQLADAVVAAANAYGVDPWELVGVARNESRFRIDEIGPDGKDCGIMQTRVTGSHYSCRRLRHDFQIAFMEGARELAAYQASCRSRGDFDRCRFNRYNSGIHYARSGFHGHYYLRVLCFTRAAQAAEPGGGCNEIESHRAMARAMRRPPRLATRVARRG